MKDACTLTRAERFRRTQADAFSRRYCEAMLWRERFAHRHPRVAKRIDAGLPGWDPFNWRRSAEGWRQYRARSCWKAGASR